MSFTQVIEAQTVAELKSKVADLNNALNPSDVLSHNQQQLDLGAPPVPPVAAPVVAAPVAAKKGKAKKEEEVAPAPAPAPLRTSISASELDENGEEKAAVEIDPFAEEETAVAAVTVEDVKAALMKVKTTVSMKHATDLFKKYGADRISEIKESDFAAIVADCEKLLGGSK